MSNAGHGSVVKELSKATGVNENEVAKVLEHLGLSRIHPDAMRANQGNEPSLSHLKVAFKIGKSTIIV